jgi:hypothetical protein
MLGCGLALAVSGCGGGSSGTASSASASPSYLAAVTRAAALSDSVPGYKMAIETTAEGEGRSVTASGSGTVAAHGEEGAVTVEAESHKVEELFSAPYAYIQIPNLGASKLTHGKRWARIDVSTFTQPFGGGSAVEGSSNATRQLEELEAAGSVTRIGAESVRGVPSTHYHVVVDFDRLGASIAGGSREAARKTGELLERITGSKTLPMDVWIGGGRVSRISYGMSTCVGAGQRLHESFNMELFDYGRQAVVVPPPASQVADIDAQVKAKLAKVLATLSCD